MSNKNMNPVMFENSVHLFNYFPNTRRSSGFDDIRKHWCYYASEPWRCWLKRYQFSLFKKHKINKLPYSLPQIIFVTKETIIAIHKSGLKYILIKDNSFKSYFNRNAFTTSHNSNKLKDLNLLKGIDTSTITCENHLIKTLLLCYSE